MTSGLPLPIRIELTRRPGLISGRGMAPLQPASAGRSVDFCGSLDYMPRMLSKRRAVANSMMMPLSPPEAACARL
jgi:hypothetical protein